MDPSPTLQSKSELFWYCQSSALASQIVTLRSNFAVWQDTGACAGGVLGVWHWLSRRTFLHTLTLVGTQNAGFRREPR